MIQPSDPPFDLPPLDVAAWRPVRVGLRLMRNSLLGIPASMLLWGVALPIVYGCLEARSNVVPYVVFVVMGFLYLGLAVTFLIGMGVCCLVPGETGSRRFAVAAVLLTILAFPLGVFWLAIQWRMGRSLLPPEWAERLADIPHLDKFAAVMLLTDVTLAVACWQWFVGAVGRCFDRGLIAESARPFMWWFGSWTAGLALAAVIELPLNPFTEAMAMLFCVWTIISIPVLFVWSMVLLSEMIDTIDAAIEPLDE